MTALPPLDPILNDTAGNAVPVNTNFSTVASHITEEMVNRDGSVAMTAPLGLVAPTADSHAARKVDVDAVAADLATAETLQEYLWVGGHEAFTAGSQWTLVEHVNSPVKGLVDPDLEGVGGSGLLIAEDGWYRINVVASLLPSSSLDYGVSIRVSGTNIAGSYGRNESVISSIHTTAQTVYYLNAGDGVQIQQYASVSYAVGQRTQALSLQKLTNGPGGV